MKSSVGICSNVDLRSLELFSEGTPLMFLDTAIARTSLAPDSPFWSEADSFLVFFEPGLVLPGGRVLAAEDDTVAQWFEARLGELSSLARSRPGKPFVVANVAVINDTFDADVLLYDGTDGSLQGQLNSAIQRIAQESANIIALDWARLVATHGAQLLHDEKYWYMGRLPLSGKGARLLWDEFGATLKMANEAPKKVLCLDLDNTLWRGICGETGPRGVGLSEEGVDKVYRDLQRYIKALKDIGVLLVINSKNNADDALAVFRHNPMMILREADFAAMRINWSDKVTNLCSLAEELSVGLDAFVFVDDSDVEREMVRVALPGVTVPDFPSAIHELPNWFRTQVARKSFRRRRLTREDQEKTGQYHRRREREAVTASLSHEDAIARLGIEISIEVDSAANLPRLHQMVQKTNQFNLTTLRYTEAELKDRIGSDAFSVWNAWYRDKFGDEGIVAMAVVSHAEPRLESFLMSCRVIGRGVEFALLRELCADLLARGVHSLGAEYRATAKNGPCRDLLPSAGFDGEGDSYTGDLAAILARLNSRTSGVTIHAASDAGGSQADARS